MSPQKRGNAFLTNVPKSVTLLSYIFSTSNCIYTGMRLARYELMLDVWRREEDFIA